VAKKFNWARVLKHELVHVITLQQTRYNCPHWFTEALAVWSEGYPRPQEWNELLIRRVPKGELFNLTTINAGFTRPHSSDDWQMAYCQAELYLEYMLQGRDQGVVKKLLAAYADNLATPEAIRRVLGVSQEGFERGYVEYLKKITAGLAGLETPRRETFAELVKAQKANPKDADLAAELGYAYLRRGASQEARGLANLAWKLRPKHQLAGYILARMEVQQGRPDEAVKLLEGCLDEKSPGLKGLNLLAGLKLKGENYAEAERLYALGAQRDPQNLKWVQALAQVHLKSGEQAKLAAALARLAHGDGDDFTVRKKLAQMAMAEKDYAKAADWANRALEINVQDVELYRLFAESSAADHNYPQAIELFETAIELDPTAAEPRFALADAYLRAGKPEQARQAIEGLRKLAPDYPGVDSLLEKLEEKKKP
jgi:Flp pilus assembly protein TadD